MAAVPPGRATAFQDRDRLDREPGQGGMATVYFARALYTLDWSDHHGAS